MIKTLYEYREPVLITLPGNEMWHKPEAISATTAWKFLIVP